MTSKEKVFLNVFVVVVILSIAVSTPDTAYSKLVYMTSQK